MSIRLNNIKIPGHDQKVSIDLKFPSEDLSGNSSSTAKASKGHKGKALKVQTSIKFENAADLSSLVAMAEATDSNGDQVIYHIINDTAKAMNMRQGSFDESFSVKEADKTQEWLISFTLSEHHSVPEKKEARQALKQITEQVAKGVGINSGAATQDAVTEQSVELTGFERILKNADDWLGKQ